MLREGDGMDGACVTGGELPFARTGAWHKVGSVGWGRIAIRPYGGVCMGEW